MTIVFKNISKHYFGNKVLEDFNLELPSGRISCLLGQSGIGKTTLLNILAGIVRPDSGALVSPYGNRVNYLFQDSLLLPWMTVRQNICYLMEDSIPKPRKLDKADRLIHRMELDGFGGHYPSELSGGMARRTALARTLAMPAPLLIMDEPFASLDSDLKTRVIATVLENIEEQKRTAVIVTHDMRAARQIGDHIFMAEKDSRGRLVVHEHKKDRGQTQLIENTELHKKHPQRSCA